VACEANLAALEQVRDCGDRFAIVFAVAAHGENEITEAELA
jgi:hypothetical protein